MKAILMGIGVLMLLVFGVSIVWHYAQTRHQAEEQDVRAAVSAFGEKLRLVPLLAPEADRASAMRDAYSPSVAPELLTQWTAGSSDAPGRLTSSPYPARIDIRSVTKKGDAYTVAGDVIELTSVEETNGGIAGSYPVVLTLEKRENTWMITSLRGYPPQDSSAVLEEMGIPNSQSSPYSAERSFRIS